MFYHYTFRTYMGKPLLEEQEIRVFLGNIFQEIADSKDFTIVEYEILCDHVHMLIEQSYMLSTSIVMKNLKGISARRLFQEYKTNRYEIRKLWGRSFDARKVSADQKDVVINYIKGQRLSSGIDKRF